VELQDVLRSLWHRWYIVVLGLLAAGGAGYTLMSVIPPTYEQVSSSVMIPGKGSVEEGANPLLYLTGLTQQRDLVVRAVQTDDVREPILAAHPGADFAVEPDYLVSGPVVMVTATGPSADATTSILQAANAAVARELAQLQSEVDTPVDARSTLLDVATDSVPTVVRKKQLQVTALGAGGVLLLSILAAVLVDGRLQARASRRRPPDGDAGPADAPSADITLASGRLGTVAAPPTEAITVIPLGKATAPPRQLRSVRVRPFADGEAAERGDDRGTPFQQRRAGSV
jgi:hypothetical protein